MARYLFDTVCVQTTAPGLVFGAGTVAVAQGGDTLLIKDSQDARLLPATVLSNVSGEIRIRSSAMHGNNGIQVGHIAAQPYPLWPSAAPNQKLTKGDTVAVDLSGSAVAGQIEIGVLPIMYTEPGSKNEASLIDHNQLKAQGTGQIAVVRTTHIAGVVGGYSTPVNLNAGAPYDLIGNKRYALLGALTNVMGCAVTLRGPATGGTRIAIPAHSTNKDLTSNYLYWLTLSTGFPCMPVVSTADAGTTIAEVVSNQAGGTYVVNWIFMLLQ